MIPINYLAVIVAAIAAMGLGMIWYGPLFGKKWIALMGWSAEDVAAKQAEGMKGMKLQFGVQMVSAVLMAYVLAHALVFGNAFLQTSGTIAGIMGAFWYWLGFVAPVTIGSVLWDGKPWTLWFINAGYYLATLVVMGAILGFWV